MEKQFGPYEILAPLGAGGMGEVYRAKDTRLHREVAFKILSGNGIGDPERQRRFTQEARAASALNHPNILSVYDVGTENGQQYIVSELIEGESLRKLIQKGPVPIKRLLEIAVQIADGLAAAHQAGILHRDLKPENIMITREGRVKILDFGLAKPLIPKTGGAEEETASAVITESGIIVGTIRYMSPEQAGGENIDFRSDQFSLGLILYEMATGKQAFVRNTPVQTLSAIVSEEPTSISTLNPKVPVPLRWLIERCLTKDRAHRYGATVDLYHELRNLRDHLSETTSADMIAPISTKRSIARRLVGMLLLLITLGIGWALSKLFSQHEAPDLSSYRFTPLATSEGYEEEPSWSPDGKTIAYSGEVNGILQIFTRSLDSPVPAQITQSPSNCNNPFWSPDGTAIFYYKGNKPGTWRVSAAGGTPELVMEDSYMATISPDGKTLAFMRPGDGYQDTLWISSPPGAEPKKYAQPPLDKKMYHLGLPHFSPDGSKIGFSIKPSATESNPSEFWILPYPAGKPRRTLQALSHMATTSHFSWMPDNKRIVLGENLQGAVAASLWIADTEANTLKQITIANTNEFFPAVSPDGQKIAFTMYDDDSDIVRIPIDGSPLHSLLSTSRSERDPDWSPTGNQFVYIKDSDGTPEIWLKNIEDNWERPLVTQKDFGIDRTSGLSHPIFSPDGQRIVFGRTGENGLYAVWISSLAGGSPIFVTRSIPMASWSPDGRWIVCFGGSPAGFTLVKVQVGKRDPPIELLHNASFPNGGPPKWSPKGDWIACETTKGFALVSPEGKVIRLLNEQNPLLHCWSNDGSTIFAVEQTEMKQIVLFSIDVSRGKKKKIADLGSVSSSINYRGLSLAPDGKSLATSISHASGDIWLLEGFNKQLGFFDRLWRR